MLGTQLFLPLTCVTAPTSEDCDPPPPLAAAAPAARIFLGCGASSSVVGHPPVAFLVAVEAGGNDHAVIGHWHGRSSANNPASSAFLAGQIV